jgi:hypothetical protein
MKNQSSRDFQSPSIFDFFNSIDPERTSGEAQIAPNVGRFRCLVANCKSVEVTL